MPGENERQMAPQKQDQPEQGQSKTGPGEGAGNTGQGPAAGGKTGEAGGEKTPAEQRSFKPDDANQASGAGGDAGRDPETDRGQGGDANKGVER